MGKPTNEATKLFFAQNEPPNHPIPRRHFKPYTHKKSLYGGGIEIALKDTGGGRITALEQGKPIGRLYISGFTWQQLHQKAEELYQALTAR